MILPPEYVWKMPPVARVKSSFQFLRYLNGYLSPVRRIYSKFWTHTSKTSSIFSYSTFSVAQHELCHQSSILSLL